ncbi:MAG: hypothetical protein GX417_01565 [Clostridiales bacterium]|nr:hypothetical protein [Clostridiales bacterium]
MQNTTSKQDAWFWKRVLFTSVPLIVLFSAFAKWMLTSAPHNALAVAAATLSAFLFALLGIRFIPQWMAAWSRKPWLPVRAEEGRRSARRQRMHPIVQLVFYLALFRVLLFFLAYLLSLLRQGYAGGLFDSLGIWNQLGTDSQHYLNIAENGYVSVGDDRLLIVFLPLYPYVVRAFNLIFQNYLVSGLIVSNLCWVFAAYLLYELALLDTDRRGALRALKYLCILPASFLFSAPLSDSLFLLLSVACVYAVRKNVYPVAGVVGFLAAFTRMPGILLFVPACFELVGTIIRQQGAHRRDARWKWRMTGNALSLLFIPAGLLLYLYVNYRVTGSATMFLTYQSEHWHQSLGLFFGTMATIVNSASSSLFENNLQMFWGLWIPNIVFLLASLSIVIVAQNKLRASNVAYFIAYYAVCMGATWLLSAPRYLTAAYPLALALGAITEKKSVDRIATIVCGVLFVLYLLAFINQWYVY